MKPVLNGAEDYPSDLVDSWFRDTWEFSRTKSGHAWGIMQSYVLVIEPKLGTCKASIYKNIYINIVTNVTIFFGILN